MAKADLREKLATVSASKPTSKTKNASEPHDIQNLAAVPSLEGGCEFESTDTGIAKVQVKPQKGRNTIVVLMFKGLEEKKFSQRAQIVVSENMPLAESQCLIRIMAQELVFGSLTTANIKIRKTELLLKHQQKGLLDYLECVVGETTHYGFTVTNDFVATLKKNKELENAAKPSTTAADADQPTLDKAAEDWVVFTSFIGVVRREPFI